MLRRIVPQSTSLLRKHALRSFSSEAAKKMNIAFFSAHNYDTESMTAMAKKQNIHHDLRFFPHRLNLGTAPLATDCDIAVAFVNDTVDGPVLTKLKEVGVKAILLRSAGYDMVDLDVAEKLDMPVMNVPSYSPYAVAEHAAGLMMTLNRKYHRAYNRTREFNFNLQGLLGFDLHGKTVGVIGTGKIGALFSKIASGFGCKVLAYDVHQNPEALSYGVEYKPLDEVLAQSDIVSLHCPLFPSTYHLINEESIKKMKKGVMLINTSRGGLIDTHALMRGLINDTIGSVALDVFEGEKGIFYEDHSGEILADEDFSKLFTFPNVLITGHQAYFTQEALENIAKTTMDNILIETKMKKGLIKAHSEALLPPSNEVFAAGTPLHATLAQLENKNARHAPAKPFLAEKSLKPENTELFAYTNALLHRVTGRYLPASVLGNDQTQAEEVKHLQSDQELIIVIQSVQDLSRQFHDVAQAVLAHRKELGKLLLKLKVSYVGLFERVLEASMRFYYNYRQENAKERHDLKQHAIAQATTIQEHEETIRVLTHHLEAKESMIKSYQVQIQELEFQNLTLKELENDYLAVQEDYRELKRYKFESTKREEALVVREEAIQEKEDTLSRHAHYLDVQSKTEHGRIIEEARQLAPTTTLKYKEAYHKAVEEAKHIEEQILDSPAYYTAKPNATASTQTMANEDGLWDIQDGVPKSVSKHVLSTMMWKRFTAFVVCKNCHGKPLPSNGLNDVDQAYNEVWMVKHKKKRWTKTTAKEWRIPSSIMTFLANLPRTVLSIAYYNQAELVNRIEMLYDAKYIADCADAADGVAYQSMDHFVAEYYLKQCLGRQQAEIEMYKLLISVKAMYLGSPYLHLFARFLHLLDSTESSDNIYHYDPDIDEKAQTTKLELRQLNIAPQQFLSQSFLRVFLHARHQALNHPDLGSAHIISVDNITKWINLDYGIKLLKWYLSYLPESKLHIYCRQLEHNTGLFIGGTITATKGNHLAVRAQMRATMLTAQTELRRKEVVVVNVYVVLEMIIEVLLMRTKSIENELHELFLTADVNHDKVLSFAEFCTILKPRAPEFNERRLLRMFREALTLGSTQSYAISSEAFIQVCTDHGLVALVPQKTLESSIFTSQITHRQEETMKAVRRRVTTGGILQKSLTMTNLKSPQKRTPLYDSVICKSGDEQQMSRLGLEDDEAIEEDIAAESHDEMDISSDASGEVIEEDIL